ENRTKAFAFFGIAFGTGFTFGPAISGFVSHRFGMPAPFYLAAGMSALSVTLTATLLPNMKPADQRGSTRAQAFRAYFQTPLPRHRLLEFWCFTLSFTTLIGGLALFLERQLGYGVKDVGLIYTYSGVMGFIIQGGLIGRLVKRFGEQQLTRAG